MIYSSTLNNMIRVLRFFGKNARKIKGNDFAFYSECTDLNLNNWNTNEHPNILHSQQASDLIYQELIADKPCMIARFGTVELSTIVSAITPFSIPNATKLAFGSIVVTDIGINSGQVQALCRNAGFFPEDLALVEKFVELTMRDIGLIDILASWCVQEKSLEKELAFSTKIRFRDLEPYMHANPWSRVLKDKKVLVIHPFVETIKAQYKKRELLFKSDIVLPEFELKTIKAVQSIAGSKTQFSTWFDALESMKQQIDAEDFDIAIIGCGAYGMPLAAHVKRIGKKAVHLGGQTQLLFGIKGKRWETGHDRIKNMFNEYWVYPSEFEKPNNFTAVEGGAYW